MPRSPRASLALATSLALLSALALTRGVAAPRLQRLRDARRAEAARARRPPRALAAVPPAPSEPAPAAPSVAPAPSDEALAPLPDAHEELAEAPADHAPTAATHRAASRGAAPAARPLPSRLTRAARGFRLDVRGVRNLAALFPGAGFRPTPNGGYALATLDREGYLRAAGARPGDVPVALDGRPLATPDQLLDALERVQRATALSLRVRRGAVHYRLDVELLR